PYGRIIVAGDAGSTWDLARFSPDGAVDPTLGTGGRVTVPGNDSVGGVVYVPAVGGHPARVVAVSQHNGGLNNDDWVFQAFAAADRSDGATVLGGVNGDGPRNATLALVSLPAAFPSGQSPFPKVMTGAAPAAAAIQALTINAGQVRAGGTWGLFVGDGATLSF